MHFTQLPVFQPAITGSDHGASTAEHIEADLAAGNNQTAGTVQHRDCIDFLSRSSVLAMKDAKRKGSRDV